MNIENEIFKRCKIRFDKLNGYGFKKIDDKYVISKNILNNAFRIDVVILNDGSVKGKIFDLEFECEYTNYRASNQQGEFVSKVRSEFINFLNDIKDKCTTSNYFISNQANRIANLIKEEYNDDPEFAWEKSPGFGIFRNPDNDKWYALIMNINKNKIDKENIEVEIINLKLDEEKIKELLKRKGFYTAYHMNKEKWITIILDDTISDGELMSYIMESHRFTEKTKEWLMPANPKYYDVINCFNDTDTIMWKQSNNIKIGDDIYLYVASPYSCILYKCKVIDVNIPYEYSDKNLSMNKVMKIKLLKEFDNNLFTFDKLKKYGVNSIRGPRSIPKKLSDEINKYC